MGIFDRAHRFAVMTQVQHPFKHTLSDFAYNNPALPGVSNINSAFNYLVAALYPNTQPNVPTPGDLPTGLNTPNPGDVTPTISDYRVVDDDGDGRSAGYRFEQREGDVSGKWYKVFDVDWSTDAILAAVTNVTDDKYMYSKGKSDLDGNGVLVAGLYAGQKIYGGALANENLTLNANSGDGVGVQTGFVQIDSAFRPTIDNTYDLSTATERWKDLFLSNSIILDTMTLASGVISDTTGQISFDNENLVTTGNITGATVTGTSLVADDTVNTMTLVPGSITDTTGAVTFGAANLVTTGTLGAGVSTFTSGIDTLVINPSSGGKGQITSSLGTIDFVDENLETTGTLNVGVLTSTQINVDNLSLDGNTISTTDVNGNLLLVPNGTGLIDAQKTLQTLAINTTGTHTITGILDVDNIRIDGNTVQSSNLNGNLNLVTNGTGDIVFGASLIPSSSGSFDVGSSSALLNDIFISGGIRNATNEIGIATLLTLRSVVYRDVAQTQPAQNGDALFYDSANSVFLASTPDSEVNHTTISNLTTGDAGHTQFVMLTGRVGGQTIQGGTAASNNLLLESTSNVTKGSVRTKDNFIPDQGAAFSGGWTGVDLGGSLNNFHDVYSKGEFKGFRFENVTTGTLPSASAQNIGRVIFNTDTNKALVDVGTSLKPLGVSKFVADQAFDGVITTLNVDVSADITDARNAQYELLDNANNFEKMFVTMKATSASNIRIETNIPLPVGSYRLVVIE